MTDGVPRAGAKTRRLEIRIDAELDRQIEYLGRVYGGEVEPLNASRTVREAIRRQAAAERETRRRKATRR